MSLDGKILARAKVRLDERRADNERRLEERRETAYSKDPRLREIDSELRGTVIDAIAAAMSRGGDPVEAIDEIRDHNLSLQEERALLLTKAGLSPDYLSDGYICPKCRDTGYNGTEICSCLMELYRDEQRKELSALLKLGEETFDSFDLDYYDDTPDPVTGISARGSMEIVFETCRQYARKFSRSSPNLLLTGGTGLGKTFLSSAMARVVSERGFSVVYDTASSVFAKYENQKFYRDSEDAGALDADIRRLTACDLLILDDLGTEMGTVFTVSALYTLINTRLTAGKKTVISTNLAPEELSRRYSAPIASRILGEYVVLRFYGRDIRLIKSGL